MSLETINPNMGSGGTGITDLGKILTELQGLRVSVVAGAAAGTKMDVAALRLEDTLLAAVISTNAGGALADDVANITIQPTKASGTITVSGNPVADETFVVNGVTYTWKAAPTSRTEVKITTGDNTVMAAAIRDAINWYERDRYTGKPSAPAVVATAAAGVVTVTAVVDGAAGNAITLTESCTNVAVNGAGTLTTGTDTGGVKSTTNLASKSVILYWYNKR